MRSTRTGLVLMLVVATAAGMSVAATPAIASTKITPTVGSVAPNHAGNSAPTPLIAISGFGFTYTSQVSFGGTRAAVDVVSDSLIYAQEPYLGVGTVDVRVTTDGHESAVTAEDRFTTVDSPQPPTVKTTLGFANSSLSCPSADYCLVLGARHAVAFNGNVRGPQQSVPTAMRDLDCVSKTFCAALADDRAYVWKGNHWTASAPLKAVGLSCASATSCVALSDGTAWWRYDGTHWVAGTNGPDLSEDFDHDLSCPTATFCAVAETIENDDAPNSTAMYVLQGGSWHESPGLREGNSDSRTRVSCTSATYCLALTAGPELEWNGFTWSTVSPARTPVGVDYLRCFAVRTCLASGAPTTSGDQHLLRYDGTAWTTLDTIPNAGTTAPRVACGSPTACRSVTGLDYSRAWTASGGFGSAVQLSDRLYDGVSVSCQPSVPFCVGVNAGGDMGSLVKGDWQPAVHVDGSGAPTAISCVSSGSCVLVDDAGNAVQVSYPGTLSIRTHIDSRPLTGISCTGTDFCVAIDDSGYVIRYADGSWHPPTKRAPAGLRNVSCTSSSFCMAVGHGYAVRYRGSGRWDPAKHIGTYANVVSCRSATYCIVGVGDALRYWGGQAFSPPFQIPTIKDITALSCATSTYCVLVYHPVPSQQYFLTIDGAAYAGVRIMQTAEHLSCWAPQQCLLLDDGDHAYVTQ